MEKKDPPVFSKKEKIIITSIFAVLFLASIIVTAYLVSEDYPENFQWFNVVPILCIVATISSGEFAYRHRFKGVYCYFGFGNSAHFRQLSSMKEKEYTHEANYLRIHYINIFIFLAQIPFQIPLIVYIKTVKQSLWSFLIFFVPLLIQIIIESITENLHSKRKEREKQAEIKDKEERQVLQQRFRDRY